MVLIERTLELGSPSLTGRLIVHSTMASSPEGSLQDSVPRERVARAEVSSTSYPSKTPKNEAPH